MRQISKKDLASWAMLTSLSLLMSQGVFAALPRAMVLPAKMRNGAYLGQSSADPMEASITAAIHKAIEEVGEATLVDYSKLLTIASADERKAIELYLSRQNSEQPIGFELSPKFRTTLSDFCDVVVVPQFTLWRISGTDKVRLNDLTVQVLTAGKGGEANPANLQHFVQSAKIKFSKEFPSESDVMSMINSSFAKTVATFIAPCWEEAQQMAADSLIERLSLAQSAGVKAINDALNDVESLTSITFDDPKEAFLIGQSYAAVGDNKRAVTWFTQAKNGGMLPLTDVLIPLAHSQLAMGDYASGLTTLEQAYLLTKRKKQPVDGLLRELIQVSRTAKLSTKEIQYLSIFTDATSFAGASDTERLEAAFRITDLQMDLGQSDKAVSSLVWAYDSLGDGTLKVDDSYRVTAILHIKELLTTLKKDKEVAFISNALYKEATAKIKDGKYAEGLTIVEHLIKDMPAKATFWKAYSLSKLGKSAEAQEAYKAAISFDTAQVAAIYNLRLLLLAAGSSDEVYRLYSEAIKVNPTNLQIRYGLAVSAYQKGNLDEVLGIIGDYSAIKDDYWKSKYTLLSVEALRLKTKALLMVDETLTPEVALTRQADSLNKAVEWTGQISAVYEGKGYTDVDLTKQGDGLLCTVRFFRNPKLLPLGSMARVLGRIIRYTPAPKGTPSPALPTPLVAVGELIPALEGNIDLVGAYPDTTGEIQLD